MRSSLRSVVVGAAVILLVGLVSWIGHVKWQEWRNPYLKDCEKFRTYAVVDEENDFELNFVESVSINKNIENFNYAQTAISLLKQEATKYTKINRQSKYNILIAFEDHKYKVYYNKKFGYSNRSVNILICDGIELSANCILRHYEFWGAKREMKCDVRQALRIFFADRKDGDK